MSTAILEQPMNSLRVQVSKLEIKACTTSVSVTDQQVLLGATNPSVPEAWVSVDQ